MKRVWKPIDICPGYRLYEVRAVFPNHPEWNMSNVVAASSPSKAAEIWEEIHKGAGWIEEPIVGGFALNICQPAEWWENGIPIGDEPWKPSSA